MKRILTVFALCIAPVSAARANTLKPKKMAMRIEDARKGNLLSRLCKTPNVDCAYADSVLNDPRITIIEPPPPTKPPKNSAKPDPEKNPYFKQRFGLATPAALERGRAFIEQHELTFDAASVIFGVPKEIICGHFRIETRFGIPIKPDDHPLGSELAISRLVSLYSRRPAKMPDRKFERRQQFAFTETKYLLQTSERFGWDIFTIPGSSTGAVGLLQFEPESFSIAVDGDGDGTIDLFNADDAILSLAHYLVTRGFDEDPEHRRRAVFAYYGGHYNVDKNKYYMKAVLKYAAELSKYLTDHPIEHPPIFSNTSLIPFQLRDDEMPADSEAASK